MFKKLFKTHIKKLVVWLKDNNYNKYLEKTIEDALQFNVTLEQGRNLMRSYHIKIETKNI